MSSISGEEFETRWGLFPQFRHDLQPEQLKEITEPDLLYKQYFYRTATNDTMKKDLRELVNQLLDIVKPHDGNIVVDIGSNDLRGL